MKLALTLIFASALSVLGQALAQPRSAPGPNPLNTGDSQQQAAQQERIYEQQQREAAAAQALALQVALAQQAEQNRLNQYAIEQQRLADQARSEADAAKVQATYMQKQAEEAQKQADELEDEAERYRTFFIPKDPWRNFEGNKLFVKTPGWLEFQGKVLEVQKGGIRVEGGYGESFQVIDTNKEFFVANFPYPVADGESIGLGHDIHAMVAHDAGVCTLRNNYATEQGTAQTITMAGVSRTTEAATVMGGSHTVRKLDYGTPCERPDDVPKEVVISDLKPVEKEQVTAAKLRASEMQQQADRVAQLAYTAKTKAIEQAKLADEAYQKATEAERKAAEEKEKKQQALAAMELKVLRLNQDQAAKGDPYGLLRMGERYRDGDGVPKDLAKARDYFSKAAAAGEPSAADELSKLDQSTNAPAKP
jgi:hypothetical protein